MLKEGVVLVVFNWQDCTISTADQSSPKHFNQPCIEASKFQYERTTSLSSWGTWSDREVPMGAWFSQSTPSLEKDIYFCQRNHSASWEQILLLIQEENFPWTCFLMLAESVPYHYLVKRLQSLQVQRWSLGWLNSCQPQHTSGT